MSWQASTAYSIVCLRPSLAVRELENLLTPPLSDCIVSVANDEAHSVSKW